MNFLKRQIGSCIDCQWTDRNLSDFICVSKMKEILVVHEDE